MKEGGSSRSEALEKLVANNGGTLETFDFAFGEDVVVSIAERGGCRDRRCPSMAVGASGAATVKTTPLISVEEIDRATALSIGYRAPGA